MKRIQCSGIPLDRLSTLPFCSGHRSKWSILNWHFYATSVTHFRVPMRYMNYLIQGYLNGTHSTGGIWAPYQYHGTMVWKTHTISHSYQYHVTIPIPCYHTIPCHLIPYQMTSYHHTKAIPGCLGSFFKIYKLFLQAAILVHWVPFFVERFFMFFQRY